MDEIVVVAGLKHGQARARLIKMCKNMSLSLSFLQRTVIGCCLASIFPASLHAEASYKTNGGEYALAGPLPSEQVQPRLALRPSGGYVVWQDRATDGDGYGIRAQLLDSSFSRTFAPFRVNQTSSFDQEKPFVAALNGGGAVFTWQSGKLGSQRIYARYLTPTNTWLANEIQVSSTPAEFQVNASAAVLENGNVAIVWAGYNQGNSGTMQDVFCQILSSTGVKVGGEFRVNQFPAYNQRTPAIAPLTTGGFVIAWVSEQQRTTLDSPNANDLIPGDARPSVDIYVRSFLGSGAAASHETLVNTNSLTSANPSVAGDPSGGFLVTWCEMDTGNLSNGWDVFSRKFASPSSPGPVQRVNTTTYGEDFAPQVCRAGEDFFIVWNNLGRDGSMEGVFGRFIGANGIATGDEFRVNTVTISKQIHPAVASDGESQFVAVWSGFVGGERSFDVFGQRYAASGRALMPMEAPFVYAPFLLNNGVYQPRLQIIWPAQAGLPIDHYELYMDGDPTPVTSTATNRWAMTAAHGLQAAETHSFKVGYVLTDGRRSPLSASASATTWTGYSWGGVPFEWMNENYGTEISAWPPANRVLAADGPTVLHVFQSGGHPNDPSSWLRTKLEPNSQGLFLSWNPRPGLIYQVQKSTDLTQWQNVGAQRLATGDFDSLQVSQGASCYYRVLLMR